MICECGKQTKVIDSRMVPGNLVRRRRKCPKCRRRFSTLEIKSEPLERILKIADLVRSESFVEFLESIIAIRTDATLSAAAIRNAWLRTPGRRKKENA